MILILWFDGNNNDHDTDDNNCDYNDDNNNYH